ncbi:hypothetical protein HXA31_18100 [Salipaludibacillus agaradhaerens]|jgi:hypothetical protein|uniref:Cas10/Cmr2 second palm domain-containing protein n=1 Tax=Salipaludibacillus agaradhaerens TaxID=76935 RepID=A0A9Q4B4R3_SALAG|nr:hypothetical protein [Salipaludibacillus agaradhaerens]MCR6098120.1 hypothetical protein [Salipaludibacillus agaradhaerens]MCR6116250.1 hypothetical protein [Salipaludibacillus agaradhaerens]
MGQYVVAVSIDKVQTFLYYVLQAYIQENQANSGTLREIVNSSQLVSKTFFRDIGIEGEDGEFNDHINEQLLACSGMCIFTTSLDQEQITKKLNQLFIKYYKTFKGQLLVKYVVFERKLSTSQDKLRAIKESKDRLRQPKCLNEIITDHRDLLFQFCGVPKGNELRLSIDLDKTYPSFSRDINALYSQEEDDNDNHFRIAVVKADLDGMGALFEQLGDYTIYNAISQLLSKFISLDYLHKITAKYQEKHKDFKLYPLYMAGDDIFFAVTAAHLLEGINLCKEILQQLNEEINKLSKHYITTLPQLSLSVGIDFTFNREPIRYYYERVQHQLDEAKAYSRDCKDKVEKSSYMKISINDYVFEDYDAEKKSSQWAYFKDDVALLKGAMRKGFSAHHFLYGLLKKISNKTIFSSDVKFSNAVLYHLLPEHLESSNKELSGFELLLIEKLLRQLLTPKKECSGRKENSNGKRNSEKELRFGSRQRIRLERYVRMLLLFSDPRFANTGDKVEPKYSDIRKLRGTLFNKPLRYLYHQNLYGSLKNDNTIKEYDIRQFRNFFAMFDRYTALNGNRIQTYRRLQISSSMFHRFKKMDKGQIGTVAEILQSVNDQSREDIEKLKAQRELEKKAPPGLFFDKESFRGVGDRTNLWTDDYIDSLLIFYRLNELSIQYKTLYRDNNNKNKKTNKKHRSSKGAKR